MPHAENRQPGSEEFRELALAELESVHRMAYHLARQADMAADVFKEAEMLRGLLAPMISAWKALRAAPIGENIGKRLELPTRGVPAGCPYATFVMSLLVHRWRWELTGAISRLEASFVQERGWTT